MKGKLFYLASTCFIIGFVVVVVAASRDLSLPILAIGWTFFIIAGALWVIDWRRGPR